MKQKRPGTLIAIGGHEDKTGDMMILSVLARYARRRALVIVTAASEEPEEVAEEYIRIFHGLGVDDVRHLQVASREEGKDPRRLSKLEGASVVFISGGDQLRLASQLGDTEIYAAIREIYETGGTIAGTSAGASCLGGTMLVNGEGDSSPQIDDSLRLIPGFGLIEGLIIDQHFAERGRIGRLVGAVAQNPRTLGLGIDEDTAIVCTSNRSFVVIGSKGVYVVDGHTVSHSNVVDEARGAQLSVFGVQLHLLGAGDRFDIRERTPIPGIGEDGGRAALETIERRRRAQRASQRRVRERVTR